MLDKLERVTILKGTKHLPVGWLRNAWCRPHGRPERPVCYNERCAACVPCANEPMPDSTMQPVRNVGILGAGFISQVHLQALRTTPGVRVAAVCDADSLKAGRLQQKWGIPQAFGDADEMLRSGAVDVVHVLLPPPLHVRAAVACLERGCDVFLEKPMAVTVAEGLSLREAVAATGRTVGVNHNNTYHPAFLRLVDAVRDRKLGAVQHVTACLNVPLRQLDAGQHGHWMFQQPGNIILEQACHPLSQIQRLLGPVRRVASLVTGETVLNNGRPFYSKWQCSLECRRGTAQLFLSFGREYLDSWLYAVGQDGAAMADFRRNLFRLSQKTRFMEPVDNAIDSLAAARAMAGQGMANLTAYTLGFLKLRPPKDPFSTGMQLSIADFYARLAAGRAPREDVDAGLAVIAACEAIAASRETGSAAVPE